MVPAVDTKSYLPASFARVLCAYNSRLKKSDETALLHLIEKLGVGRNGLDIQ
jgi:hypothetical protein